MDGLEGVRQNCLLVVKDAQPTFFDAAPNWGEVQYMKDLAVNKIGIINDCDDDGKSSVIQLCH